MNSTLSDRFSTKVDKSPGLGPNGDCHLWTGQITNSGKGILRKKRDDGVWGVVSAHNTSWFLNTGFWPSDRIIQTCSIAGCVNFNHLQQENQEDKSYISSKNLSWVAGFLDGEGCFSLCKPSSPTSPTRRELRISVAQARILPLEHLSDVLGLGSIGTQGKGYFQWRVTKASDVSRIISRILPYLVLKNREAEILQEYATTISRSGRARYRGISSITDDEVMKRNILISELEEIRDQAYGPTPIVHKTAPRDHLSYDDQLSWAAGFIDGEGCFALSKPFKQSRWTQTSRGMDIVVTQVRPEPLERLSEIFQMGKVSKRSRSYQWRVHGVDGVENVARPLIPYLILKRREAEILVEFASTVDSKRYRSSTGTSITPLEEQIRESLICEMIEIKNGSKTIAA